MEDNQTLRVMENEIQHAKALKVLAKVKEIEKQKKGYKFVKIDDRTRVYRKV